MKPPKISICIPTYNGREFLRECLDSVRAQNFRDFEVVVCDDHSSDGTLDLARELAQGDARFRFIQNPRRLGLVGNWNYCVEASQAEWIKFVFQDDVIKPSCLETLLAACEREGKPFAFCERDFIFDDTVDEERREWLNGHKRGLRSDYQNGTVINAQDVACMAVLAPSHNFVGEPSTTLIHRSVFREIGNFDEALIQLCDAEFWCRVMINRGAAFVPESLVAFRVHAKATTSLNLGSRAFRMGVLDPLTMRHRFAFGRHFKPIRNAQFSGRGRLSHHWGLATAAAQAWWQARRACRYGDSSLITEWQAVKLHCRGLQAFAWLGCGCVIIGRARRGIKQLANREWR